MSRGDLSSLMGWAQRQTFLFRLRTKRSNNFQSLASETATPGRYCEEDAHDVSAKVIVTCPQCVLLGSLHAVLTYSLRPRPEETLDVRPPKPAGPSYAHVPLWVCVCVRI